ncbi:MAG: hypothetical protein ACFB0C_18500 [Leptolyngbyaceae cyanobacterium]
MTSNSQGKPIEAGGNIDQVRDILFGNQIRDYNGRFEKLEADLVALKEDTRDRIDQTRDSVLTELRAMTATLEKKLKALDQNHEEEADSIRQEVGRVSQKLTNNVQRLDEAIDAQVADLRRDLLTSKDNLHDAMRELRTQVMEGLEQHVNKLQDAKVSRDSMAELLMEMAMRLKGAELIPELPMDLNDVVAAADVAATRNGK